MKETIPKTNADDYCQRLKPKEKAYYIRDSLVKGLVLRVKPSSSREKRELRKIKDFFKHQKFLNERL